MSITAGTSELKNLIGGMNTTVFNACKQESIQHIDTLKNSLAKKSLTLCIGAGVTKSLIGDWSDLLNHIASHLFFPQILDRQPSADHPFKDIKLPEEDVRCFLDLLWNGFPSSTSVLEKGEYLAAQCDRTQMQKKELQQFADPYDYGPDWRELFFAEMTLDASRHLLAKNILKISSKPSVDSKTASISEEHKEDSTSESSEKADKKVSETSSSTPKYLSVSKLENEFIGFFLSALENKEAFSKIETLEAVVHLCFTGAVSHIINYNFDTLLEILLSSDEVYQYYKKKDDKVKRISLSVFNPFFDNEKPIDLFVSPDLTDCNSIRIDHVHGLLDSRLDSITPIVFSERSYANIKRASLHWSSLAIAKAVSEGVILCVGFSGDDEDFRTVCQRIIDNKQLSYSNAVTSSPHIYLLTTSNSKTKRITDSLCSAPGFNESLPIPEQTVGACTYELLLMYIKMVERYYRDHLDIQIVWVYDYPDISKFLKALIS